MKIEDFIDEVEAKVEDSTYVFEKCATRLDRDGPYHKEDVVAAILTSKGSLVEAARLLGRQRMRLRDYIYRNPDILEFFHEFTEGQIDLIERNFMQLAIDGDPVVAWKVLSTRGRDRGWGQHKTLDHMSSDGSMTPKPSVNLTNLSDEELEQLERLTDKARYTEGMGEEE